MRIIELFRKAHDTALTESEIAEVNDYLHGLERTLGIRYEAIGPDRVVAALEVTDAHRQPVGLVHGGVYASLVESAGSTAAFVFTGKLVVGVHNSTDFISAVKNGVIRAEVTPVQQGSRTQLWDVACTEGDRLVARGTLRTMVQH